MNPLRCVLVCGLLALTGCAGLLHSTAPAVQLYVLAASVPVSATADAGAAAAPRPGPTLRVARPLSGPGLNTDRIALLRTGNRLDYYAGSRWSAPLADLVSDLELSVLRGSDAWSAVADDRTTFNADYLLQTTIDGFSAQYADDTGAPTIHVDLHCLLIRRSDGTLVGSFTISRSEPAAQNHMASVVAAFSVAAEKAIGDVGVQAGNLIRSAKSPAAP